MLKIPLCTVGLAGYNSIIVPYITHCEDIMPYMRHPDAIYVT